MNTCALTRVLWPAFVVGLLVGSLAGNDAWGWVAAALTAGAIVLIQRARGTNRSCPVPQSQSAPQESASDVRAGDQRGTTAR